MGKDKRQAPAKTNVARLLTQAGIAHELVPYEVDENDLAATHIAQQLNEDIRQVFKTLVLQGEYPGRNSARSNAAGYFVCVVPGDAEVDLKKAAAAAGAKKADLIPMKDRWQARIDIHLKIQLSLLCLDVCHGYHVMEKGSHIIRCRYDFHFTGFNFRKIQNIVNQR